MGGWGGLHSHYHVQPNYSVKVVLLSLELEQFGWASQNYDGCTCSSCGNCYSGCKIDVCLLYWVKTVMAILMFEITNSCNVRNGCCTGHNTNNINVDCCLGYYD